MPSGQAVTAIISFPNTQVTIGSHAGMLQRHSDFENADGEWEGDSISLNRDPELSPRIGSISPGSALQNADCASTVNCSRERGCREGYFRGAEAIL